MDKHIDKHKHKQKIKQNCEKLAQKILIFWEVQFKVNNKSFKGWRHVLWVFVPKIDLSGVI